MSNDKSPIKLREKKLTNGNKSLYLDIYQKGVRSFEFLSLYIIPERTQLDKQRNKTTRMQAEAHRARRIIELQNGLFGAVQGLSNAKYEGMLSEFVREVGETKNRGRRENYTTVAKRLEVTGDIQLKKVTSTFFQVHKGRVSYLAVSTQHSHFKILRATLNEAVRRGYIAKSPLDIKALELPRERHRHDNYLTLQEVERISKVELTTTPRKNALKAFCFACFTGLRLGDLITLKWEDIRQKPDGQRYIVKEQQKTGEQVEVPLSGNALKFLPERTTQGITHKATERVFKRLSHKVAECVIHIVAKEANIGKRITFHTSRHTAATLLLTYGADLYVVSKLLGHSSIKTTQIYAEVTSTKKQEAVALIPKI